VARYAGRPAHVSADSGITFSAQSSMEVELGAWEQSGWSGLALGLAKQLANRLVTSSIRRHSPGPAEGARECVGGQGISSLAVMPGAVQAIRGTRRTGSYVVRRGNRRDPVESRPRARRALQAGSPLHRHAQERCAWRSDAPRRLSLSGPSCLSVSSLAGQRKTWLGVAAGARLTVIRNRCCRQGSQKRGRRRYDVAKGSCGHVDESQEM